MKQKKILLTRSFKTNNKLISYISFQEVFPGPFFFTKSCKKRRSSTDSALRLVLLELISRPAALKALSTAALEAGVANTFLATLLRTGNMTAYGLEQ